MKILFLNESGIKQDNYEIDCYNKILKYKKYQVAILGILHLWKFKTPICVLEFSKV
jgi:hypothetical protein